MNCDTVQKILMDEQARRGPEIDEHLEECAACTRFAERLSIARQALEEHRAHVMPDDAFAARVVAELPQPSPVLGWAAVRLLPAAAALLLVLSAWAWFGTGTPSEMVATAPTDDLVSWVLETGGTGE
jgi:predicted anti-sigma-YlaC factor YlaD